MPRLLFVYNADADLFSTVTDLAHKLLRPSTYPCSLCALTHGPLRMKQEWVRSVSELEETPEFLHKDEFHESFGDAGTGRPAIFACRAEGLEPIAGPAEPKAIPDLEGLMALVRNVT